MNHHSVALTTLVSVLVVTGCGETPSMPATSQNEAPQVNTSAIKFWDAGASANWNERATALAALRVTDANRMYTYLSLAQFRAAEAASAILPHPPITAAIGAASVEVLKGFFPLDAVALETALDDQEAADPWPGSKHEDFAAGEAIGRDIGARTLAFAAGDRVGLTDPGVPPIGPGYWIYNGGPKARGNYRARSFFLAADDEFRPAPPPAFGSAEYNAALAEVRQVSDTRTASQLTIAQYWNVNQSPRSNATMNNLAVELLRQYHVRDAAAARILFLANAAVFDAQVGCFDAKYHFWFIRPPQADPGITLPIGLPPHPSYPSAHSCNSGGFTGVLALAFPSEIARLEAIATEASLSRLYGGIHYRFDMVAGLALGRATAAKAWAADLDATAQVP